MKETMRKVIATQVPWDKQQSPIGLFGLENEWEGVYIRQYDPSCSWYPKSMSKLLNNLANAVEDWEDAENYEDRLQHKGDWFILDEPFFSSLQEIVEYYFGKYGPYSDEEYKRWGALLEPSEPSVAYSSEDDEAKRVTELLSLIHHMPYAYTTIRGVAQSDAATAFHPAEWNHNQGIIELLACDWFNTGTEWKVDDGDETLNYLYTSDSNTDDEIKEQIVDATGCKLEEVELRKFNGNAKTPLYVTV